MMGLKEYLIVFIILVGFIMVIVGSMYTAKYTLKAARSIDTHIQTKGLKNTINHYWEGDPNHDQ